MATPRPIDIRKRKSPITLDRLLNLSNKAVERTGWCDHRVLCTLEQQADIYGLLQRQVRFVGDAMIVKGEGVRWAGLEIVAHA